MILLKQIVSEGVKGLLIPWEEELSAIRHILGSIRIKFRILGHCWNTPYFYDQFFHNCSNKRVVVHI